MAGGAFKLVMHRLTTGRVVPGFETRKFVAVPGIDPQITVI